MSELEALRQVSVAILSCNRREELRTTLSGLLARGPVWREILVADNASTDGTPAMVRAAFPDVRLIETGGNLGVAGIYVAIERPFKIGSRVKVAEQTGTIEDIGVRVTRMRADDGTEILVPNLVFFTAPVQRLESREAEQSASPPPAR